MLRLQTPSSKPVQIWWYDLDGVRYTHPDEGALFRLCVNSGKLPAELSEFEPWYADMIHQLCLTLHPSVCIGREETGDQRLTPLTFAQVKGFLRAMAAVLAVKIFSKEPTHVSQAEADRRAGICQACTYRGKVSCVGCHGFILISDIFVQGRELTAHQAELSQQGCIVCGCFLLPTHWASFAVLDYVDKEHIDLFPKNCWRTERHEY